MERCVIIGSAPNTNLSILEPFIRNNIPIICADGGIEAAKAAGVRPQLFIGDLDSGNQPDNTESIILPTEKDFTDTHTALNKAIEMGAREIYLIGCTNGRADHYFANVLLLEMLTAKGVRGVIMDVQNRIFIHSGGCLALKRSESYLCWEAGAIVVPDELKYVSVLPLDREVSGVTLRGMKYPLENATLKRDLPIGVSNELCKDTAEINVEDGKCVIILSKDVKADA